jgi:hypothetical protein
MVHCKRIAVGGLVVLTGLAVDVAFAPAQTAYPARLVGQASLPALTLIEAPSDAPSTVRASVLGFSGNEAALRRGRFGSPFRESL